MSYFIINRIFIQVLASHSPRNVQKRKKTKKNLLPEGAARYLLSSPEFLYNSDVGASKRVEKKAKKTNKSSYTYCDLILFYLVVSKIGTIILEIVRKIKCIYIPYLSTSSFPLFRLN